MRITIAVIVFSAICYSSLRFIENYFAEIAEKQANIALSESPIIDWNPLLAGKGIPGFSVEKVGSSWNFMERRNGPTARTIPAQAGAPSWRGAQAWVRWAKIAQGLKARPNLRTHTVFILIVPGLQPSNWVCVHHPALRLRCAPPPGRAGMGSGLRPSRRPPAAMKFPTYSRKNHYL